MTSLIPRLIHRSFSASVSASPSFIFDRSLKTKQREWSALHQSRNEVNQLEQFLYRCIHLQVEYIREELGWRVADRVADLTKHSDKVLEIGHGMISSHLESQRVSHATLLDSSQSMLNSAKRPDDEKVRYN